MLRRTMSIVANAPIDRAFSYLSDFERLPEWVSGRIESVEKTSEGPVGVGSTFAIVTLQDVETGRWYGPKRIRTSLVVTELVPNERIAYEEKATGISAHNYIEVQPSNGGTLITMGFGTRLSPWLLPVIPLMFVVFLLAWPFNRWEEGRRMRRLKERVEAIP